MVRARRYARNRVAGAAVVMASGLLPASAAAQAPCEGRALTPPPLGGAGDPVRIAELFPGPPRTSGDPLRRGSGYRTAIPCLAPDGAIRLPEGKEWGVVPPGLVTEYRSAYPLDRNNGARWAGRGVSAGLTGGVTASLGPLSATVVPEASWSENRDVRIAPTQFPSPFRYPYHTLDWPQRMGDGASATFGPGQSALTATLGPVALRAATENLWWGPAHRYPILLSNSAEGFPHLALVTAEPLWIGVGFLRARFMWGRLNESAYFDEVPENDRRLLTGAFVDVSPWFVEGLTLGAGLFYHLPWTDPLSHAFDLFTFAVREQENSAGNGLASLTARWVLTNAGFEVYAELGREDFWLNTEDLLTEPDHALGFVVGLEKAFPVEGGMVVLEGEWTSLQTHSEHRLPSGTRPRFYAHGGETAQGHTHKGQLLGSSIGPGSDAQYLGVTRIASSRSMGVYLERIRRDEDAYYQNKVYDYGFRGHDLEWTVGVRGTEPVGALRIDWGASVSRRKNRNFIGLDGRNWDFLRETNLGVELGVWWLQEQ